MVGVAKALRLFPGGPDVCRCFGGMGDGLPRGMGLLLEFHVFSWLGVLICAWFSCFGSSRRAGVDMVGVAKVLRLFPGGPDVCRCFGGRGGGLPRGRGLISVGRRVIRGVLCLPAL